MDVPSDAPGSFCWVALSTPDVHGALAFYRQLFGWEGIEDGRRTTFVKDEWPLGWVVDRAFDPRYEEQPPNWMPFVRTADIERTLRRAEEMGARCWLPVMQVPRARVALVQGATKEIIGLIETPTQVGSTALLTPTGVLAWFELVTPEPAVAQAFYGELFGWRFNDEGNYTVLTNGSQSIGGVVRMQGDWEDHAFLAAIGQAPGEKWDVPPHWMVFFQVNDAEVATRRAESLGARIQSRPDTLHTFGQFAVIRDPQQAYFSIFSRT